MRRLVKILTIDKEFVFVGQIDDFNERLKNLKDDIKHMTLNEHEIKFSPTISWGTMTISGGVGLVDGINVRALISSIDNERLRINLKTRVRPEHYFIVLLFIFLFAGTIFGDESRWLILYVFGLWIICHLWFHFIYRLQENYLIEKMVSKLRLSKM